MPRLKSTELGYYIPSFFEMHVNTYCDDLTINKLPLKDMTVCSMNISISCKILPLTMG